MWKEALPAKREEMLENGAVTMVAAAFSVYQAPLIPSGNTEINGHNDLLGKVVCAATGSWSAQMIVTTQRDTKVREPDAYTKVRRRAS